MIPMMKVRVNGFQIPLSIYQVIAIVSYLCVNLEYFYILSLSDGLYSVSNLSIYFFYTNCFLILVVSIFWFLVSYINPDSKSKFPPHQIICFPNSSKTSRFCGVCKKNVLGMDHHCIWLNTCIGNKNYIYFLHFLFFLLAQMIIQLITAVLINISYYKNYKDDQSNRLLQFLCLFAHNIMSSLIMLGSLSLSLFHIYLLLFIKMGTYDWMMKRRNIFETDVVDVRAEQSEERKQQLRDEWQRRVSIKQQSTSSAPAASPYKLLDVKISQTPTTKPENTVPSSRLSVVVETNEAGGNSWTHGSQIV